MNNDDTYRERTVTLSPSGRTFAQSPGVSLLEAGLSAGIPLPYRCANGSCGECRARIVDGSVKKHRFHDYVLPEADRLRGECLLCSMTALEDVVVEVSEASSVEDIPQQSLEAKLCHVDKIQEVSLLRFKFIRGKALRFLPGQYVNVRLTPDSTSVLLPISSCPCESSVVEFHISNTDSRSDTAAQQKNSSTLQLLWTLANSTQAGSRQRITISGPFGGVSITDPPMNPQLFLAQGIEFRVLQGLIEHLFNMETQSHIGLIWLSDSSGSQYRYNLCRSWADAMDNFRFLPIDSIEEMAALPKTVLSEFKDATVYQQTGQNRLMEVLIQCGLTSTHSINLAELVSQ